MTEELEAFIERFGADLDKLINEHKAADPDPMLMAGVGVLASRLAAILAEAATKAANGEKIIRALIAAEYLKQLQGQLLQNLTAEFSKIRECPSCTEKRAAEAERRASMN